MLSEGEKKAIEYLNDFKSIEIMYGNTFVMFLEQLKKYQQATNAVLNIITKQQKENEELRKGQKSLMQSRKKWKDRYYKLREKNRKIIDLMAEYISNIQDCPLENCGVDLDCENRCDNNEKLIEECWKIYFESKVHKNE